MSSQRFLVLRAHWPKVSPGFASITCSSRRQTWRRSTDGSTPTARISSSVGRSQTFSRSEHERRVSTSSARTSLANAQIMTAIRREAAQHSLDGECSTVCETAGRRVTAPRRARTCERCSTSLLVPAPSFQDLGARYGQIFRPTGVQHSPFDGWHICTKFPNGGIALQSCAMRKNFPPSML